MGAKLHWTRAMDARLRRLAESGMPVTDMAREMGLCGDTLHRRAKRLGFRITTRNHTIELPPLDLGEFEACGECGRRSCNCKRDVKVPSEGQIRRALVTIRACIGFPQDATMETA